MKNKFSLLIVSIFCCLLSYSKIVQSNEIKFESQVIDVIDQNLVEASGGVKITNDLGQRINADNLKINNVSKIHKVSGNISFEDNMGNKILSENLIINENKKIYTFKKDVKIISGPSSVIMNTNELIYNQTKNTFVSPGITKINKDNEYFIDSENVIFLRNENKLFSRGKTVMKDSLNNIIEVDEFEFFKEKNYFTGLNSKITDEELNTYKIQKFYYDFNNKEIYGKDIAINHNNELLLSKNHVARAKARSVVYNADNLKLKKSVYTNCKKRDGCPPWLIEAEEINHDKKNKIVKYKNAKLKFYDIPILYFPKFFHPDPSVKRQSGFLTPKFTAQNTNSYLALPYFFAISESSDFTFSPRFYDNSQNLYQGEYRKVNKNSNHTIDFSIKNKNPFILDNNSTKTHFFSESNFYPNINIFEDSKIEIKLQSVSDEKYLKNFKINSPIMDSETTLNSQIKFEGSKKESELTISSEIYEDLTKEDNNDRYEIILPNYNYVKSLSLLNLDGLMEFNSFGYNKLYNTNVNEKIVVNDLSYKSLDKISNLGFISNYEFLFKNFNSDSSNSTSLKNNFENTFHGIAQFNTKIPMVKEGKSLKSTFTPILAAKFNPGSTKNLKNEDRFIDYTNIFSVNRISSNQSLEGGASITLGSEYKMYNKLDETDPIFQINLAASLRDEVNEDLPIKSSLGQKISNIVGESNLKINQFFDLDYSFLADNNLGELNYHNIKSNFKINNFVTSFEFIEENNNIGNESFIAHEASYEFDKNKSLFFRTRKNKTTNLTEYYDLIYQYKMDCLTAGIEYKKSYYNDGSIKPEESIYFSITFLPFSNTVDLPGIK